MWDEITSPFHCGGFGGVGVGVGVVVGGFGGGDEGVNC